MMMRAFHPRVPVRVRFGAGADCTRWPARVRPAVTLEAAATTSVRKRLLSGAPWWPSSVKTDPQPTTARSGLATYIQDTTLVRLTIMTSESNNTQKMGNAEGIKTPGPRCGGEDEHQLTHFKQSDTSSGINANNGIHKISNKNFAVKHTPTRVSRPAHFSNRNPNTGTITPAEPHQKRNMSAAVVNRTSLHPHGILCVDSCYELWGASESSIRECKLIAGRHREHTEIEEELHDTANIDYERVAIVRAPPRCSTRASC